MRVRVQVTRRPEISDPQGIAVGKALTDLGYEGVGGVRIDRTIEFDLETDDVEQATIMADEMCRKLLANPVMEDYEIMVIE